MYKPPLQNVSFHRRLHVGRRLEFHRGHRIAMTVIVVCVVLEGAHIAEHAAAGDVIAAMAGAAGWLKELAHKFVELFVESA